MSPAPSVVEEYFEPYADELGRLLELRRKLGEAKAGASSPAIGRALSMAEDYVFLALGYLGYSDELFPQE